ncbi:MAG: hypothetical protein OEQ53_10870, partial [Saprospiraceae bacterium]|nr:hypothetical protein [Saprospiraceae bacterium]
MQNLLNRLEKILVGLIDADKHHQDFFRELHPNWRKSAANLIHYLKLRTYDLRGIQDRLSEMSISSLAHSEGYTYLNLKNVINLLHRLHGTLPEPMSDPCIFPSYR